MRWAGLRVTAGSGSQNKNKSGFSQIRFSFVVKSPMAGNAASYECGAPGAAAAVVAVDVAARQVGRGHERVALVGAAVLSQRVYALLTVGLPGVCHGAVAVGVPPHQIHAVLREKQVLLLFYITGCSSRNVGISCFFFFFTSVETD